MTTVTLKEAQARLPDLIESLAPGAELVITKNQQPVARLLVEGRSTRKRRKAGNCKGMVTIVADDEEHLKEFEEYME